MAGDGRELYYVANSMDLTAVEIQTSPQFTPGAAKTLFRMRTRSGSTVEDGRHYDPAPDGKRFLVSSVLAPEGSSQPLTVVLNWAAGLPKN